MSSKLPIICLLVLVLSGCGPSAKELADQKARQSFREAVAAVKICTQGASYQEFREKRLALETSYTANQSVLADQARKVEHLVQVMKATDALWHWQIEFPMLALPSRRGADFVQNGWAEDPWEAMLIITPEAVTKTNFTYKQSQKDRDFSAKNYVQRGLAQISDHCDELLR